MPVGVLLVVLYCSLLLKDQSSAQSQCSLPIPEGLQLVARGKAAGRQRPKAATPGTRHPPKNAPRRGASNVTIFLTQRRRGDARWRIVGGAVLFFAAKGSIVGTKPMLVTNPGGIAACSAG